MQFNQIATHFKSVLESNTEIANAAVAIEVGEPAKDLLAQPPAIALQVLPGNFLLNANTDAPLCATVFVFGLSEAQTNVNDAIARSVELTLLAINAIKKDGTIGFKAKWSNPVVEFDEIGENYTCSRASFIVPFTE
jgi:hypothetical protein